MLLFSEINKILSDILIQILFFKVMKTIVFRGDLAGISAKKASPVQGLVRNKRDEARGSSHAHGEV